MDMLKAQKDRSTPPKEDPAEEEGENEDAEEEEKENEDVTDPEEEAQRIVHIAVALITWRKCCALRKSILPDGVELFMQRCNVTLRHLFLNVCIEQATKSTKVNAPIQQTIATSTTGVNAVVYMFGSFARIANTYLRRGVAQAFDTQAASSNRFHTRFHS